MKFEDEVRRRRTFAIISHPDAGKTTLTEKLLLYAKAIHLAGSVKAKRASRGTISDWMKIEQERGISVTSSVLQFDYEGSALNLLDTPGHADFSEDTFRTLAAVDSAVMLMDHAKGVEPRTLKLFEVCRMRKLPVVTFMNKLDRYGLEPLELVDQVRDTLDLEVAPINWPLGMGEDFKGVVDLASRDVIVYEAQGRRGEGIVASRRIPFKEAEALVRAETFDRVSEELELIEHAGDDYSHKRFLAGEVSPLFWGSAMSNFGVEELLSFLATKAAAPGARRTEDDEEVQPEEERFTGFVFKIQANMNPRHRDGIAFMRVVSGKFERGMDAIISRSGEVLRLSKPHTFMAQERSLVEEAWPGDIVGLYNTGKLRVGDTLSNNGGIKFAGIPRFAPEHFGQLRLEDPMKRKALDTGLDQLSQEGVIQLFLTPGQGRQNPYLGAVGMLQFEVLKERLKNEYKVSVRFVKASFSRARWVGGKPEALEWLRATHGYLLVEDRNGQPVVLTDSNWNLSYALENAPGLELYDVEPM
ncbi:MAG: peptide chain release factor 3 [Acidobacteriota bacterium]|nr:MAG: peptide chain release factor 3 [Acidobacteriota bacterium]